MRLKKMKRKHREIIRTFIDDEIRELNVYSGYKGGIVLKILTISADVVSRLQEYCTNIEIECRVKHNQHLAAYEVFCVVEDEDVYSLKDNHYFL
jgi:hypothetical protein